MRALVTGSRGFVGNYLRTELESAGYEVIGLNRTAGEKSLQADLQNAEQTAAAVKSIAPDMVIHLAGQANVAKSWTIPQLTLTSNVIGAVNLMEAIRAIDPQIPMVLVGSSDQYGNLGEAGRLVNEMTETQPQTPYAVSKKAQEEMAKVYVRAYGMHICMTRSFNHYGPGQKVGFLIPDFASGIARVEKGLAPCLKVGNLSSRRDFTHVRDVVHAYRLLAEKGKPGEVYNVGSGVTYSAQEILDKLCSLACCPVPVVQDPERMRPSDTKVICCDHRKLTQDTGWQPSTSLDTELVEVLDYYRNLVAAAIPEGTKS